MDIIPKKAPTLAEYDKQLIRAALETLKRSYDLLQATRPLVSPGSASTSIGARDPDPQAACQGPDLSDKSEDGNP